ncbi:hypothetical protein [Devosia sp.]|uniref:hypothetical protein n=1 Tax=Devosia sp. TaxID=1871048 RepID=UPI002AFFACCD|nr:hypothetical protein [Devosia sp.]
MSLSEPTKSTRAWQRRSAAINDQLRKALKARGITTDKKRRIAIQLAASGRADMSDKAKLRLAARRKDGGK